MAPRLTYDWNLQGYRTPLPGGEGFWGQQGQYLGTYPGIGLGGDPWGDLARAAGLAQYSDPAQVAALQENPLWNAPSSPFFNQEQYRQEQLRGLEIPGTSMERGALQTALAGRAGAPPAGFESPEFFTDPLDEPIWISGDEARARGFNVSPFVSHGLSRVIQGTRRQFSTPEGTAAAIAASPQSTNMPKPGLLDGILGMLAPFIPVLGPIAMAAHSVDRMRTGGSIFPVIANLVSAVAPAFSGVGLGALGNLAGVTGSLPGAAAASLGPSLAGTIGTSLGAVSSGLGAIGSGNPLGALTGIAPLALSAGQGFFGPGTDGGAGSGGFGGEAPGGFQGSLTGGGTPAFGGEFNLGGFGTQGAPQGGFLSPSMDMEALGTFGSGAGFPAPQFGLGGPTAMNQQGQPFSLGGFGTSGAPQGGFLQPSAGFAAGGLGPTVGPPEGGFGISDAIDLLSNLAGLVSGGGGQAGDQNLIINRPGGGGGEAGTLGFEVPGLSEEQISTQLSQAGAFQPAGVQPGPTMGPFEAPLPPTGGAGLSPFGVSPQTAGDPYVQPYPGLSFPGPFGPALARPMR